MTQMSILITVVVSEKDDVQFTLLNDHGEYLSKGGVLVLEIGGYNSKSNTLEHLVLRDPNENKTTI